MYGSLHPPQGPLCDREMDSLFCCGPPSESVWWPWHFGSMWLWKELRQFDPFWNSHSHMYEHTHTRVFYYRIMKRGKCPSIFGTFVLISFKCKRMSELFTSSLQKHFQVMYVCIMSNTWHQAKCNYMLTTLCRHHHFVPWGSTKTYALTVKGQTLANFN